MFGLSIRKVVRASACLALGAASFTAVAITATAAGASSSTSTGYACPTGSTLSGAKCIVKTSEAPKPCVGSGGVYNKKAHDCVITEPATKSNSALAYKCTEGTLSGAKCIVKTSEAPKPCVGSGGVYNKKAHDCVITEPATVENGANEGPMSGPACENSGGTLVGGDCYVVMPSVRAIR